MLVNGVFDGDQIKIWGEKHPNFYFDFLKAGLREEVKSCDQRGGAGRSLIFLTAPTGSAEREQGKMEKKGKTEMYYSTSVMTINI